MPPSSTSTSETDVQPADQLKNVVKLLKPKTAPKSTKSTAEASDVEKSKESTSLSGTSTASTDTDLTSARALTSELVEGWKNKRYKGWRCKTFGKGKLRRDNDLVIAKYLQEYQVLHKVHDTKYNGDKRCPLSKTSSPLTVCYLNYSWGVSNSFHRDLRRRGAKYDIIPLKNK